MMTKKRLYRYLLISIGIFGYPLSDAAQIYNKVILPFTMVSAGESEWVDLDGDNDLDLIFFGDPKTYVPTTLVYENINGAFTERGTTLPNIHYGSLTIGDYDKDGDPDILFSGNTSQVGNEVATAIYRNDGGFVFTKTYSVPDLAGTTVWLDVDNDEDLDFILAGLLENRLESPVTLFFENTGSGFVQRDNTNIPNCLGCVFDVADGNGDGRIDILMTSWYESGLYLNNGNQTFTKDPNAAFRQLNGGVVKWGDFDRDGDLDVLLTGSDAQMQYHTLIYENSNGSFFERTDIALLGFGVNRRDGAQWFDYNNDGWLDLLLTGRTMGSGGQTNRLYWNTGAGTFIETIEPSFDPLDDYSIDVGDFDNDGDVDLSFEGYMYSLGGTGGPFSGYFQNTLRYAIASSNTKPLPPNAATFTQESFRREIRLKWDAGSDAQTPADGLTYNFYLRDATKKIVVPSVDFTNGKLRTTNLANGFGKRGFVNNVPEGQLYYAVQSVDGSKAGSVFSAEKTFYHFNGPECAKADIIDGQHVKLTWMDHSALETNFKISRSTDALTGFVQLATPAANTITYTDNFNFLTETYYYYRINGYNATHTSAYDSLILMIPERITGLTAQSINASKIQLTWEDHSQYETGFVIERKKSSESVFVSVATVSENNESFEDTGLEQGTLYDYRVRAISKNGGLQPITIATARTNFIPAGINFELEMDEDTTLPLLTSDFESHFSDTDITDNLAGIKIKALPENGTLYLSGIPVVVDQEIPLGQLSSITFSPTKDFVGSATISAYAYDGKDYSIPDWDISIRVNQVNDAPVFAFQELILTDEDFYGDPYFLPTREYVPYEEDQIITYSLVPATSEIVDIVFDKTSGRVVLNAKENKFGEIEFTITADDGQKENNTSSRQFKLTINPVNDAPFLAPIDNIVADLGAAIPPITINVSDVDNTITLPMLSAFSGNQQVLKSSNVTFKKNGEGSISMTIVPERKSGITSITVSVNDGALLWGTLFFLEITNVTAVEHGHQSEVFVSPNPVINKFTISLGASVTGRSKLVMHDVLGREVREIKLDGNNTVVDAESMLPGVYLLSIFTENGKCIQRKIIKK